MNIKWSKDKPTELLAAMRKGHSFQGACGEIGIGRTQAYAWVDKYPEFKKAKEKGDYHALSFLEKCAVSSLTGVIPASLKAMGSKKINVTMAIFLMKTRFHEIYGERMRLEGEKDDDSNTITIAFDPDKIKGKGKYKTKKQELTEEVKRKRGRPKKDA